MTKTNSKKHTKSNTKMQKNTFFKKIINKSKMTKNKQRHS